MITLQQFVDLRQNQITHVQVPRGSEKERSHTIKIDSLKQTNFTHFFSRIAPRRSTKTESSLMRDAVLRAPPMS